MIWQIEIVIFTHVYFLVIIQLTIFIFLLELFAFLPLVACYGSQWDLVMDDQRSVPFSRILARSSPISFQFHIKWCHIVITKPELVMKSYDILCITKTNRGDLSWWTQLHFQLSVISWVLSAHVTIRTINAALCSTRYICIIMFFRRLKVSKILTLMPTQLHTLFAVNDYCSHV